MHLVGAAGCFWDTGDLPSEAMDAALLLLVLALVVAGFALAPLWTYSSSFGWLPAAIPGAAGLVVALMLIGEHDP